MREAERVLRRMRSTRSTAAPPECVLHLDIVCQCTGADTIAPGGKQERTVSWRPPRLVRAPCERSTVCCLLRSCLGAFIVQLLCVSARALREAGVLVHSGTLRTSGRVVSLNGWMRMTRLAVGPAARRRNSVEPVRGRTHATPTTPRATRTTCARSPSLCPRVGYTCHPMDGF